MRIRKRFPPPSLSSAGTSDPQLNPSPMVQQNHLQTTIKVYPHGNLGVKQGQTDSQPSDPPNLPFQPPSNQHVMVGSENSGWVSFDTKDLDGEEVKEERWREEEEKSNDTRGSLGQDQGTRVLPPSGSHQVVERWFEGGKAVPLKKRRGGGTSEVRRETKMKLKNYEREEREAKESIENTSNTTSGQNLKKCKRGGVIMEGSRCSRVNGRGWRCSQKTLVGYSLCEHHLGNGRLRCITRIAPHNDNAEISSPWPLGNEQQKEKILLGESYDDDEKKVMVVTKKRMKLGVVKARSISSLLGQTNNAVVVAEHSKTGC